MDFRSKYLDIHDTFVPSDMPSASPSGGDETPSDERLEDVDFCLELLHSDIINVAYILELIANLNPYSTDYAERRKNIIDTMIKDAVKNRAQRIFSESFFGVQHIFYNLPLFISQVGWVLMHNFNVLITIKLRKIFQLTY